MNVVLDDGAYLPERAHETDAGLDLRTPERIVIHNDTTLFVDTRVHVEIPCGYYGDIKSKSGLMRGLDVFCRGGVIDCGYVGSIWVGLKNESGRVVVFNRGDKIAQLIITPCSFEDVVQVDRLPETERGDNGFGSTGR